jgi:hypothetical protein
MPKIIKKWSLLTLISLSFVQCKEQGNKKLSPENVKERTQVTGGWKTIAVSEEVKKIASYAHQEKELESPILNISNVSYQVVSGKNYHFQMHLENDEIWETTVYVNLKKEQKITSFKRLKKK